MLQWYLAQLSKRPMLTTMWSTGAMLFGGDVIAQQVIERKGAQRHDWVRTARMTAIGALMIGPAVRTWILTLEKVVGPSVGVLSAAKKLAIDQFMFAPSFLAVFITVNNLLQGNSIDIIKQQLRDDYPSIVVANWMVWGPSNFMNFYLIPVQHRVMFANCIALVWNSYLTWKTNHSIVELDTLDNIKVKEMSID